MHISANEKLKLKENHYNSDCITSHHLGEWKTILQFGGKDWNIIAARESFIAQISQSYIGYCGKNTAQRSETKTTARKRVSHRHVKYDSIENESSWRIIRDLE